jgi:hypothetical protein
MRRDEEWLVVYGGMPEIREGEQILYTIEPLNEGEFAAHRTTSPVTQISLLQTREQEYLPRCLK